MSNGSNKKLQNLTWAKFPFNLLDITLQKLVMFHDKTLGESLYIYIFRTIKASSGEYRQYIFLCFIVKRIPSLSREKFKYRTILRFLEFNIFGKYFELL